MYVHVYQISWIVNLNVLAWNHLYLIILDVIELNDNVCAYNNMMLNINEWNMNYGTIINKS